MRNLSLVLCLAAAQLLAAGEAIKSETPNAPRYSREQLDRIRRSFAAQIAVWDSAEKAMRTPTPAEAAALASSGQPGKAPVPVKGGGVALKADSSQMSFAVVEIAPNGKMKMSHAPAKPVAQGGSDAR